MEALRLVPAVTAAMMLVLVAVSALTRHDGVLASLGEEPVAAELVAGADGDPSCNALMSAAPREDIALALSRAVRAARSGPAAGRAAMIEARAVLACALTRAPTDGYAYALLAFAERSLGARPDRVAELLRASHRTHPVEVETMPVRLTLIASAWGELPDDVREIGRADQSVMIASNYDYVAISLMADVYREAGTRSPLYAEALTRIGRFGDNFLQKFEGLRTGAIPRGK